MDGKAGSESPIVDPQITVDCFLSICKMQSFLEMSFPLL